MNNFTKKEDKKEVELKKEIEKRIKEYELAIVYFKNNKASEEQIKNDEIIKNQEIKNEEQIKKGEEYKEQLKNLLDKINLGEKIEEKLIPKEITPEFIYGYSNEERIRKYYEIIIKIIEEKKKLKLELDEEIKQLKKLKENQIISMEKEILNDFEKIKLKKQKYDEIINLLTEDFKNKWIPAPLYSEKEEVVKLEKINEDIPENTIRIEFKKTDYLKNKKVMIEVELKDTNYKDEWEQNAVGDWSHIVEWQLNEDEYKDISKKVFYFKVTEKLRGNKKKFKGDRDIQLKELENHTQYKENFEFTLKTKRMTPHVDIEFKIRKCIKPTEDQFEDYKKRVFCFTKFYPPFKEE